jgi:N-acetylmuramoyl-L-alanine amidase
VSGRGAWASAATVAALMLSAGCAALPRPAVPGEPREVPDPPDAPAGAGAAAAGELPPIPPAAGPLRIRVVYPAEGAVLTAADSNFIFGSVGRGDAALTIDGARVEVAPNGAFLAFLPVPRDGVYRLRATGGGGDAALERRVSVPAAAAVPPGGIDPGSLAPRGAMTVEEGELVEVRLRGVPGLAARVVLPDGRAFPLRERPPERPGGFMQDVASPSAPRGVAYAGVFPAVALRAPSGGDAPVLASPGPPSGHAVVEIVSEGRTRRHPLELTVGVLPRGVTRTAVAAGDRPDGEVIGVALPGGGTPYHWSFPNGTRFTVTGEREGQLRVRLTEALTVWIDASQLRLLPAGEPPVGGTVGTVRAEPAPGWIDLRLSTSERLPFEVRVEERTLSVHVYGARSRTNWLHYGVEDPLLRRLWWEQLREDEYVVRVELAEPVWGWRAGWDAAGRLVVSVRRPPRIDPSRPLAGIRVAVDAGHPPGGAVGPTGYTEAEANLAITRALVPLLREAGADVLEIRPTAEAVELGQRPVRAAAWDAHVLVSIHNNAFPDGVNPWVHHGTSTFFNRPQSLDLARRMQRELLAELGMPDLGVARADLALVRPTWMPSVLTESLFMMIPVQEAALRDPTVQRRIARAHLRALEAFLRGRAAAGDR